MENVDGTATTSGGNVTTYTQPLEYTANGNGGLTAETDQYWPTSGNGLHIYGVYPYSAVTTATTYNSTGISFSVNDNQSTDAGYNASDLMTGAPESNPAKRTDNNGTVQLTFTHLLSKIDINIEGDGFSEGDLSSAKVSILNTKPSTTFNVQNTTLGDASGDAASITVCTGIKGSAIIVPQTVENGKDFIKVEVSGGTYIYKLASETTFNGQTRYTYNITVAKTGLTVTSKINAWATVGTTTSGTASLQ